VKYTFYVILRGYMICFVCGGKVGGNEVAVDQTGWYMNASALFARRFQVTLAYLDTVEVHHCVV